MGDQDIQSLAKKTGVAEKELRQEYKVLVRFNPRGDTDPCGWQVISMDPAWVTTNPKHTDEDHILVRCTFISERDGTPPSKLFLGSGGAAAYKDRYWKAVVWRFPPGSYGFNRARPVVVYRGDTFEKMPLADAEALATDIGGSFAGGKYTNDDDVPDGFKGH